MIPPIMVPIRPDMKGFANALNINNTGLRRMEGLTRQIGENLINSGKSLRQAGWASMASLTLPIAMVGKTAIKSFSEFDDAVTHSLAIATKADRQLRGEVEALATSLSTKLAYSVTNLAEGFYYLISAGYDVRQSMKALQPAAMFARASNMELARSTELLLDTQLALGLGFKDPETNMRAMVTVADALVYAAKRSDAEVVQFTESFTNQAAAMSRAFGQSMNDTLATMMSFAQRGEKGQRLGMRMSQLLRGVSFAAERSAESFKKYGLSLYDTYGRMKPLYQIIGDIEQLLSRYSDQQVPGVLLDLGFTEKSLGSIMTIRGASAEIKGFRDELETLATGSLKDVAGYQLTSFAKRVDNVKNAINNMMIDIGKRLAPFVLKFWQMALKIVEGIRNMSEASFNTLVKIAAGLAALGPALLFFGGIKMLLGTVLIQFSKLIRLVSLLRLGLASMNTSLLLLLRSSVLFTISFSKGLLQILKIAGIFSITFLTMGVQWALSITKMIYGFEIFCARMVFGNALTATMNTLLLVTKSISIGLLTIFGQILVPFLLYGPLIAAIVLKIKAWREEGGKISDVFKNIIPKITGFMYNIGENFTVVLDQMEGQWKTLFENMFYIAMAGIQKIALGSLKVLKQAYIEMAAMYEDKARLRFLENRIGELAGNKSIYEETMGRSKNPLEIAWAEGNLKTLSAYQIEYAKLISEHEDRVNNVARNILNSVEDFGLNAKLKPITFDTSKLKFNTPSFDFNGSLPDMPGIPGLGSSPPGSESGGGAPDMTSAAKSFPTWASYGSKDWYNALLGGPESKIDTQISLMEQIADNTSYLSEITPLGPNAPKYPTLGSANEWFQNMSIPGAGSVLAPGSVGENTVIASTEDMKRYASIEVTKQEQTNELLRVIKGILENHFTPINTQKTASNSPATVTIQ